MLYTVTEEECYIYNSNTKTGRWIKSLQFWHGDLSNIDFKTDDRFYEVKDKRKQIVLLGTVKDVKFPVKFPLILDNMIILDGYEDIKYDDEREI